MKFGGPQKCAAVAAMAVTVMAALVHFALAGESGWDAPIAFGMLFLASWAAIEAAFKLLMPLGLSRTNASSGLAQLNSRDGGEIERNAGAVENAAHPASMERAEKISRELQAYIPLFERVRSEADAVSATTEEAAISLMGGLRNVDETISALLTFLERSGSNEKVIALIQNIEEHLSHNRQILSEFLEHRNRDIEDSKLRLGDLENIASSLVTTALSVQGIASESQCCR